MKPEVFAGVLTVTIYSDEYLHSSGNQWMAYPLRPAYWMNKRRHPMKPEVFTGVLIVIIYSDEYLPAVATSGWPTL